MRLIPSLVWRGYSLATLAISPHRFFSKLAGLDWYREMLLAWVDWIGPEPGSRLLEVGCSTGVLCRSLAVRGYSVVGMDRAVRAIKHARGGNESANLKFVIGDGMSVPFAQNIYTCALAGSLLNVVTDPQQLVGEMVRVTAVDGSVSLLFPTPHMQADTARGFIRRNGLRGFSAEAILLWAARAPKLLPGIASALLASTNLSDIRGVSLLDGMVYAIAGRKVSGRCSQGPRPA